LPGWSHRSLDKGVVGDVVGLCPVNFCVRFRCCVYKFSAVCTIPMLCVRSQCCVYTSNTVCTNPMLCVRIQCCAYETNTLCTNRKPRLVQVTGRAEPMAVGKLAVNLVGCPAAPSPSAPSPLAALLQVALPALLPACHVLPLSLDLLNKAPFVPRKDYVQNRWAVHRYRNDTSHLIGYVWRSGSFISPSVSKGEGRPAFRFCCTCPPRAP
jgi:hypothetical protein